MKRKLVFLFMSRGSATPGSTKRIKPKNPCGHYYNKAFKGECYFIMIEELVRLGIIDEVKIFFESNSEPGLADFLEDNGLSDKIYCEVIPEIRFVKEYIDDNTIIFVRGGFKHWHDFLVSYKGSNWLMIYAANTGRQKWPFWDIVLGDLGEKHNYIDLHWRYHFKFTKPTNESIFYFKDYDPKYDVCIGASHIHDRKGQHIAVEAIDLLRKKFNYPIKAVLPGSSRGGAKTIEMFKNLSSNTSVEYLGYISKKELSDVFNYSKLFVHMGHHGQNDRSLLEAIACGTPAIYKSLAHHDRDLQGIAKVISQGDNTLELAKVIKLYLDNWNHKNKTVVFDRYKRKFGFYEVVIPKMAKLFDYLFSNEPTEASKKALLQVFYGWDCKP